LSSFRWNEVIFQSFQSGNLKQLDLEFYLKLRLPTTKRMYRFLDKRFYRRSRLDFDLRTLACEHIGLSRTYAPTELKRRLKPALEELEQLGFLEPLSPEERYSYVKRGCWRIMFIRGCCAATEAQDLTVQRGDQLAELIEALKARGVTRKTAQELVDSHPPSRIRAKIEVLDWLLRNADKRVGKNPAGYLVASIRSDYQAPSGFQTQISASKTPDQAGRQPRAASLRSQLVQQQARDEVQAQRDKAREAKLRAAWEQLTESERESILAAVKADNPGLGRWKKMLEPLCLAVLETRLTVAGAGTSQKFLFTDADIPQCTLTSPWVRSQLGQLRHANRCLGRCARGPVQRSGPHDGPWSHKGPWKQRSASTSR